MTLIRYNPRHDLMAWHPGREFVQIQHEIDELLNNFRGDIFDEEASKIIMPAVDIVEKVNDFNIKVDLSGVDKNDVKIIVQNDILTIKGEKKNDIEKNGENYHRIERRFGTFQRSFSLPASVASDKIDASIENGVLTVIIPKLEESKPKEIEVKIK